MVGDIRYSVRIRPLDLTISVNSTLYSLYTGRFKSNFVSVLLGSIYLAHLGSCMHALKAYHQHHRLKL